ncbi:hypothetical protein H9Y04_34805 [Streptomyces sp. TRM66268-LWL]|uniref:Uncharacterized protein n=1 Tax=Streptomyces polyasparticus TaxID=2767826 RepID=A0ABR7SSR2_9ACTN|nr:hypothetical protein [Streptomyces polyasparticus]MBC9717715.1 hypothetical protein [Streptomyces polyasparticus]
MDRPRFPDDLLAAQTAWYATYERLVTVQDTGAAAHRRHLLVLSRRIAAHPFWQTPAGTPAARVELKELGRRRAAGEGARVG